MFHYRVKKYEYTVWVDVDMMVVLLSDGTVWERPVTARSKPWTPIDVPQ